MLGLSHKLIEHRLHIEEGNKPHKQLGRSFNPELLLKIKGETERLLKVGFIRTTRYMNWLSNIVLAIKKNGQVRICLDFRDLNLATPKDEYVIPIADMLIDAAANNGILTFMDGYSSYNQIYLAEEDIHKIAFCCPGSIRIFEWIVMPFELKNTGAAYQRAINLIFHDLIGRSMEVYIDDVVVKLFNFSQHLADLEQSFIRM